MQEIEHKFLVRSMDFLSEATEAYPIDQGYLHASPQPYVYVYVASKASSPSREEVTKAV